MNTFKPLTETNPYLRDPAERQKRIARSVRTSSAVEGIKEKKSTTKAVEIRSRVSKKIYKTSSNG